MPKTVLLSVFLIFSLITPISADPIPVSSNVQINKEGEDVPPPTREEIQQRPRSASYVLIGNNQIFGMKVIRQTNNALDMEIDYNYDPQGEDWANLSAAVLNKGQYLGFMGFVPARLVPGRHKAILTIDSIDSAPDCFTTDEMEIKMYRGKGYDYPPDLAMTMFQYQKMWTKDAAKPSENKLPPNNWIQSVLSLWPFYNAPEGEADRGFGPGYARIGEVKVNRETNDTLELKVRYVYDPQQSRFAELSAGTYLAPYSPNFDRHLPMRIKPGFNTAIIKIERSPMAPAEYKTDKIRIVIVGNYQSYGSNDRLFVGETFTYPKTWSKILIPGLLKDQAGQPLPREGENKANKTLGGSCPETIPAVNAK